MRLGRDWHELEIRRGVDLERPGLYAWQIDGVGSYVGKYKRSARPLKHYRRNVQRLLEGRPYRLGKPDGYRRIHRELANAVREGRRVVLIILENADIDLFNARERELIAERGSLNDV